MSNNKIIPDFSGLRHKSPSKFSHGFMMRAFGSAAVICAIATSSAALYFRNHAHNKDIQINAIRLKNDDLQAENQRLIEENRDLKTKIEQGIFFPDNFLSTPLEDLQPSLRLDSLDLKLFQKPATPEGLDLDFLLNRAP